MTESPTEHDAQAPARRQWYQAIGPGLITACVVIGPGSILTSSKVGATFGFRMVSVTDIHLHAEAVSRDAERSTYPVRRRPPTSQ